MWLAVVLVAVVGLTSSGLVGVAAAQDTAPTCSAVSFSGGNGSADDPYEIENVSQLQCIEKDLDAHYELVSDVDASATSGWNDEKGFEPIGSCTEVGEADPWEECSGQQFTGTFDGNSHTVSGLTIDRPDTNGVGLFAAADEARFTNLRLASVNITGGENTGGLAGQLVSDKINTKDGFVGNVSVNGIVTGELDTAGVVGHGLDITLEDQIVFIGTVVGSDEVGGILGRSSEATAVSTSYVRATVEAKGDELGRVYGDEAVAGGLVGNSGNPSDFTNVYTVGSVSGDVAGSIVGGGNAPSKFEDVYWDTDKGPNDAVGGYEPDGVVTPLSTAEMQGVTAEENMDFDWAGTWQSVAGDYPVFQWEAAAVGESSIAGIDATDVTAVVNETGGVTVVATDEFGNRLESMSISVDATDGLSGIATDDTETTDSNGQATFTFTEETAGTYDLTFSADESITDTATVTIREGVNCAVVEYSGDGSTDDPYEIDSLAKLQCINQDLDAHYELVSDVDASATSGWNDEKGFEPIGNSSQPFTGTFDGNDSTISELVIDRPQTEGIGLFGHVGTDGEVRNATLEAAEVTGGDEVGVVVGDSAGSVTNVTASGNVTGDEYVGGVVGYADSGVISDSHGSVTVNATNSVGGLVGQGWSNAAIRESVATGSVNASGSWAGGLVGDIYGDSSIKNSMASGNVTGSGDVGGLIGYSEGVVTNATAAGTVSGSDNDVGGLIGYTASGELANVTAFGDVSGEANDVGGLVGDNSVTVTNATASGNVSGEYDEIGGLVGNNSGLVTNVAASGTVTGDDEVGGLIGDDDASVVRNATASGNVTGDTEAGGLIGVSSGTVRDVTASGSVTGTTDVGGLIGDSSESVVQNATASGNVTGDEEAVGGLIGDVDEGGKILNSYATGDVSSSASWAVVGGLVGDSSGERIADSFATGNVTTDGENVGGLVGIHRSGNITNVTSSGAVSGTSNVGGLIGKVAYSPDTVIRNASATGNVTASGTKIGGFVGLSASGSGTVIDSVARGDVNVTEGYSRSTALAGGFIGKNQFTTLTNVSASGDVYVPDANRVGGLIGENNGESLTDAIARGNVSGEGDVGGLIGRDVGRSELIVNATATGQVTATGDDVGGLIGFSARPKTLENIRATGHVTGNKEVGGLVGDVRSGIELTNATASGDVEGTQYVGGLAGELYQPTITDATATGDVTSTATAGSSYAGGLIGEMPAGTISASAATGNVTAAGSHVGGLVGLLQDSEFSDEPAQINESYATGDVTGNQSVGGLAGKAIRTNITNAYATGSVDGNASLGGLVGNVSGGNVTLSYAVGAVADEPAAGGLIGTVHNSPTVQNTYWDNQTTERTSSAGAGAQSLLTVGLKGDNAKTNATGFDFQNTWDIRSGAAVSYPYLRNNTQSPPPGLESPFAGGTGSESSPFEIKNWYHLDNVSRLPGANYTLVADLDSNTTGYDEVANASANDEKGFEPIGSSEQRFVGTFDGRNRTISNLYINRNLNYVGLFSYVGEGGDIYNLTVVDVNITAELHVGGVAGTNGGTLRNISVGGTVRSTSEGYSNSGGLVGENTGTVRRATADVTTSGTKTVGGLVGINGGTIKYSSANGNVSGSQSVGGLVGVNFARGKTATIEQSSVSGDVTGDEFVGGLAGQNFNSVLNTSSANGTVTGDSYVGGLAGVAVGGQITDASANATVEGTTSVGGLVGTTRNETVVHSYAVGNVTGDTAVGGLVGNHTGANANVTEAYAAGTVSGGTDVGGLIGTTQASPTVESAYWDTETTAQSSSEAGTGLNTSQLKANESLAGFDFQHTWDVVDNETHSSYPYLRNNTQSPPPGIHELAPTPGAGGDGNDDRDSGQSNEESSDSNDNSGNGASTSGGSDSDDGDNGRPSVSVRSMAQPDAAGAQDGESDVAPTSTTGFVVSMRNVDAGEQIAVDFTEQRRPTASQPTDEEAPSTENEETPSGESAPRNVQSDGLVLTVSEEGDYELTVTARDVDVFATAAESSDGDAEPSDGEDTDRGEGESSGEVDLSTDAFDEESTRFVEATSARPVGFITVEHTFDSDDLETATHRFRVRKSYLAATGATAESVALYREEPEGYRALSTRRVGEDDAYYYFEADTPGFSTFVIGTEAPIFDLGGPTLEQADVETGVIDASVPVENIGTEPGTYTVRLRGDGVVLAETEVSVPAGETVEATVRATVPDADGLALTVAGESLGEFTVEDSDADGSERTTDAGVQSTADAEDATDEPSDTADGSAPGGRFLVLLVAAVLVVVAVWALRRRDEP
ncbi:hypothetical protein DP106_04680 [Halonotius pteroides]|uniref:GLUG domain-containing protein n=1 Tax=Halonotius pteroides TaxID=268735 RepID=A0A3A6QQT6_9EURY|nr:hypothetical protein DP106_04680 [Halonotius pteroides]